MVVLLFVVRGRLRVTLGSTALRLPIWRIRASLLLLARPWALAEFLLLTLVCGLRAVVDLTTGQQSLLIHGLVHHCFQSAKIFCSPAINFKIAINQLINYNNLFINLAL